ncbi:pimeloyl-[acyl-carrier protein] methyl ester esterase [Acinetobacter calcoaceticus]|uniref:Pimeloyl-[acyl-carrier protein] methyl ester esterase n=1 Tax=Acinetobacter calcoaceticus TaxID=471 RepID=A0A4R1XWG1_ACICA|nr:pimeloyl-[acyl-carrier protein] methyl ester esterase [Acinetobacter calcoaceticus]
MSAPQALKATTSKIMITTSNSPDRMTQPKSKIELYTQSQPKILLITGWGMGITALKTLQQQLDLQGFVTDVIEIFDVLDPIQLDHMLNQMGDYDLLMGWSLGGQLAMYVAAQYFSRYQVAKPVITLGSNPCFVAQAEWPIAMPVDEFQQFKRSFQKDPNACVKRFCFLVTQGDPQTKKNWLSLQSLLAELDVERLEMGLNLLEQLNLVTIWKNYPGKQLHLLAKQDAVLNHQVARNIDDLAAKLLALEEIEGSHAFPVFQAEQTVQQIMAHIVLKVEN